MLFLIALFNTNVSHLGGGIMISRRHFYLSDCLTLLQCQNFLRKFWLPVLDEFRNWCIGANNKIYQELEEMAR